MHTYTLFAQENAAPADKPAGDKPSAVGMFFPFILLALFVLVVMLPASRRQKREQAAMMAGLKAGAKVQTAAGLIGVVTSIKDGEDEIGLRSGDSRLRVTRSSVVRVLGTDESESK